MEKNYNLDHQVVAFFLISFIDLKSLSTKVIDFAPLLADSNPIMPLPENKSQTELKLNMSRESKMLFLTLDFVGPIKVFYWF